jgi:hypothetical protein
MEQRKPQHGDVLVYVDPHREEHNALVTAVHGDKCVNLVYVSTDESKHDSYGRQIQRETSCVHRSLQQARGNFWRWPDEQ